MTNDVQQMLEDLGRAWEIPEDLERFKLIPDADLNNLVPGCLIGWYYKDDLEHWKRYCDNQAPPEHPQNMPYYGIGFLASGKEWRGGAMETEDVVISNHRFPTEKCYPDAGWATLHRLLSNPDLACVRVAKPTYG